MIENDYLKELEHCELCEHRCRVNRLKGETGVCRMTLPTIASAALHPAPPESYTVFVSGCNFKCLNCQNWTISQYPDNGYRQRGYIDPKELAEECVDALHSSSAKQMGADRIFFSGGEATIHLPFIEQVVKLARELDPEIKVNFDTNGYLTDKSMDRVLSFATSITYDLKAYTDEMFLALTGASSGPVLRNAEYIGKYTKEKIWEYRILVIPGINENEIRPLAEFLAAIDRSLPVCFLAFRPNFALEDHPGATWDLMKRCVDIAEDSGLENVKWAGHTDLSGITMDLEREIEGKYSSKETYLAGTYAYHAGCQTHPRNCVTCTLNQSCRLKTYIPKIST